ncbi:glycoside hydrolase family 30 beta sandwich domain-containing protein [Pedobacter sp. Leaf250]|uniref:glycoside hydrolase family 30 protein n=1 Tax=Pedobacter sp. Leaf250 TaxID=2876559 RepID=UPI001E517690|nr:glycoside hydrolase family 30 beta sandwich domain-containing protein [Pedobacter sp. Leaf250]
MPRYPLSNYPSKNVFLLILFLNAFPLLLLAQLKVESWETSNDKSMLLSKKNIVEPGNDKAEVININAAKQYQSVDGFGFALTGGSAQHIIRMSATERSKLLNELFGNRPGQVGISYIRVSIGASDLNEYVFSYDDLKAGETDPELKHFSLSQDEKDVVPVLKEILAISPKIKIMGSPWSAPVWMKSNQNVQGGRLKDEYYSIYADYFVKYIEAMKKHGIVIDAVTVQNEPFNDGNTPSMQFLAKEELRFIRDHLGPNFKRKNIKTKIVLYDHNCDAPEYPISILADQKAAAYIDGSGFHLYAGQTAAMGKVHDAFPGKNLYFTEMMAVSKDGGFNTAYPVGRILIGALRNWSKNVILWNLAADLGYNPHTDNGGCSICQGAVTIDGDKVVRNLAYYVIAHASKFVPVGSYRIESSLTTKVSNVAFLTPEGKRVLIISNNSAEPQLVKVVEDKQFFFYTINKGSSLTHIWSL